jgi:transcriptional regulator with XRE-family HTH domain
VLRRVAGQRVPQPARDILRTLRISQRVIALATGTHEGHVSRVMSGGRVPSAAFAKTVAELCERPEEELFRPGRAVAAGHRAHVRDQRAASLQATALALVEVKHAHQTLARTRAALSRLVSESAGE